MKKDYNMEIIKPVDVDDGVRLYAFPYENIEKIPRKITQPNTFYTSEAKSIPHPARTFAVDSKDDIVFKGFPNCVQTTTDKFELRGDISDWKIYKCHEGTIINVFYADNRWFTATSKRLDAFNSRWVSTKESFGERFSLGVKSFLETFNYDYDTLETSFYDKFLDKARKYCFILEPNAEERIVCQPKMAGINVYHLCTFDEDNVPDFDDEIKICGWISFPTHDKIDSDITDSAALLDYTDALDEKEYQGVICYFNGYMIKILSRKYARLYALRGSEKSLKYAYLKLRCDRERCDAFKALYADFDYDGLENDIYKCCKFLFEKYYDVYVYKTSEMPRNKYVKRCLLELHNVYMKNNRIALTLNSCLELMSVKYSLCNKALNEFYKYEKSKKRRGERSKMDVE